VALELKLTAGAVSRPGCCSITFGIRCHRGWPANWRKRLFPTIRASAVFIACAVLFTLAPTAVADPADPLPGNGFFRVGPDIAPGLYHTGGTASTIGVWINNLPTPDEMCSWFTYSTPDPEKDHVVQANSSMGPMYANIPTTIKAFESQNCQPWTRVP
jgi:hypothetical protein